jgi:hypothetical protein
VRSDTQAVIDGKEVSAPAQVEEDWKGDWSCDPDAQVLTMPLDWGVDDPNPYPELLLASSVSGRGAAPPCRPFPPNLYGEVPEPDLELGLSAYANVVPLLPVPSLAPLPDLPEALQNQGPASQRSLWL